MPTNQMPAARSSGRIMSGWLKLVSPALKLMNVLTTATDASAMAVAAGIPSSRTSPEDWRVKSPLVAAASGVPVVSLMFPLQMDGTFQGEAIKRTWRLQPRRLGASGGGLGGG